MKQTTLPFPQGEDKRTPPPRRAAIYMRMSTDLQQYSTENQTKAIYDYAEKRNIEIVRKYVDEGKSGLKIDGREALQQLMSDVQKGGLDFSMILVLDVTAGDGSKTPMKAPFWNIPAAAPDSTCSMWPSNLKMMEARYPRLSKASNAQWRRSKAGNYRLKCSPVNAA